MNWKNSLKMLLKRCLEGISITSDRLNVKHDAFIWESRFIKNGSVAKILKSLDAYIQKNEVVYMDLNEYGIEKELILIRSDGTSLYSTRDLAYHVEKSENSDLAIDVLGSDHKLSNRPVENTSWSYSVLKHQKLYSTNL